MVMFKHNSGATPSQPVVRFGAGVIRLLDRKLFADPAAEDCVQFVERSLAVDAVAGVEIDHPNGAAIIRYAPPASAEEVLVRLAEALRTPAPEAIGTSVRRLLAWNPERCRTRVYRCGAVLSSWELKRLTRDHVQLRHEVVAGYRHLAGHIRDELKAVPGVRNVRMLPFSSSLLLHVDNEVLDYHRLLACADQALHLQPGWHVEDLVQREVVLVVKQVRRTLNLLLAGASFVMALIGAVVPGIPTVPFLLLTSYFLMRSSPALNERLLRSRFFGPMIRDWQQHRAVRRHVKWTLLGITLVLLALTVWVAGASLPLLLMILPFAIFSMYMVLRIPTILPAPLVAGKTP